MTTSDTNNNLESTIEALLYFFNEPVSFKKLAKLLNTDESLIEGSCKKLQEFYQNRGMRIVLSDQDAQLVAIIHDDELLESLDASKSEQGFTAAVLETLSIVLYLGSASEATIDKVRGVRSSRTLRKLLRRGYLNLSDDEYSVSGEALRQLGVTNQNNIPNADSLKLQLLGLANNEE